MELNKDNKLALDFMDEVKAKILRNEITVTEIFTFGGENGEEGLSIEYIPNNT